MKGIDAFGRNIILVFLGTALVNVFNLLYQLLIAHCFMPEHFAAFNSLLAIYMLISMPLATFQTVIAKYVSGYNSQGQSLKIHFLLSLLLRKSILLALLTFVLFYIASPFLIVRLKIPSVSSGYILAALLGFSWITPVYLGALQGLELFKYLTSVSVITGALKLLLAFIFIWLGFKIAGALAALLLSSVIGLIIPAFILRNFLKVKDKEGIDLKEFFFYMFPVIGSSFFYMCLVNLDMVMVKYYFNPDEAGVYALAQMVGKIFLFLPSAISLVMLPHTSGLNARNMDTTPALKRSLRYALILCLLALLGYNIFPSFVLKLLTGKALIESTILGRLFSISMTFFTLLFILITYFISIKDLRFIKYLFLFTVLQIIAIALLHKTLIEVQFIMCANSVMLFFIHFALAFRRRYEKP